MGIQVTSGASALPAVTYDRVHVTNLSIVQPLFTDNESVPIYTIEVHYRMYGVVDGVRYYDANPPQNIIIPDYISVAMAAAQTGDMTMLAALQGIEQAVAKILANQVGMQVQTV